MHDCTFYKILFCLEICEKSGEAGHAPHESDPTMYYQCVKNNASGKWIQVYLRDCGPGTIFVPKLQICGFKVAPHLPLESTIYPESTTPKRKIPVYTPHSNPNTEKPTENHHQRINGNQLILYNIIVIYIVVHFMKFFFV